MSYTMYTPLNVWLDPASVTDVVAYIQNYLNDNPIYSQSEIEALITAYLTAHPQLIGVQSVNGKTGTVVLSASDITTENDVTIENALASLSSQISTIAASVTTNTNNIAGLTGRMTTAETDISNLKSNLTHYNINDYAGNSLNEKWDLMKRDFNSWEFKHILIPTPTEDNTASIKVGNDVKWKVTAPLVFDDNCNCCDIEIYGELYAVGALNQIILIDDADKPENINFINGIQIRANRHIGNTITTAIEVRAGARINFFGQTIINDCATGIVIGGANQSNASECFFDRVQIGFYDVNAIYVHGDLYPSNLYAQHIEVGVAQSQNTDCVIISNNTNGVLIGDLIYGTDVSKDGYTAYDAGVVLNIKRQDKDTHNIMCKYIYATSSDTVVKIDANNGAMYDMQFDFLGSAKTNAIAIDAIGTSGIIVNEIKSDNLINVRNCYNSRIGKTSINASDSIDRFVGLMPVVNIDGHTGINDTPSIANKSIGTITIVSNANGKRVYLNTGDINIPFDGQMFVPVVTSLPTPAWNLRGKMYRVNNDAGTDTIAICIRYNGTAYRWFDIISNSVI